LNFTHAAETAELATEAMLDMGEVREAVTGKLADEEEAGTDVGVETGEDAGAEDVTSEDAGDDAEEAPEIVLLAEPLPLLLLELKQLSGPDPIVNGADVPARPL
jgi:hypothetical protein